MQATQELVELQDKTEGIRNVCIIAHVDHGKTTLSDSLISSNGIISEKLAGKVRYLDSTVEEQSRGITMESSAISLLYENEAEKHLINLIDSPGHVDFSSDVSTAVRLCDGALLLVDVVEGVCAQTHAVLRQAWKERVQPCLVLNKMDRLIVELKFSPAEAYQHICRIVEQVNVILSTLIRADMLADEEDKEDELRDRTASGSTIFHDWYQDADEELEQNLFFSPDRGNVVFASAYDGWAFGLGYFANFFAKKLDLPMKKLRKWLWGEYFFNPKTKKAETKPFHSKSTQMFVQMVLEPIWNVYSAVQLDPNPERVQTILRSLRIAKLVPERDLKHSDRRVAVQAVMRKWLPLSNAVLRMVVRMLPSPKRAQMLRVPRLLPKTCQGDHPIARAVSNCDVDEPTVVFISKMISVDLSLLSDNAQLRRQVDTDEVLVAFCRVFSGTLRHDTQYHILGPKYDKEKSTTEFMTTVLPGQLRFYMLMGRELLSIPTVPAGNVVGIVGLNDLVLKTATLTSTLDCPSLTHLPHQAKPIVRVAVEPEDPRNFDALEKGLRMLYRSDPTVQVRIQETGEHVIVALGELHLERCISDLRDRFARVPIRVSDPIVGFRETVVAGSISAAQNSVVHDIIETVHGAAVTIQVKAVPLAKEIAQFLEQNAELIRSRDADSLTKFRQVLIDTTSINPDEIWSCGPRHGGPNLLLNRMSGFQPSVSFFDGTTNTQEEGSEIHKIENSIITGFQLATAAGPLCDEPVWGVGYIVESVSISIEAQADDFVERFGPLTGQSISIMKAACTRAFLSCPVRLVEAIYSCSVQCPSEQLGKCYSVFGKRRGNIYHEELSDGTSLFTIKAYLPVIESFGFSSDLLSSTSGSASNPQLTFSHWERIELDPYFQPSTEEEREEHGEQVLDTNIVRKYIDMIRRRKGLATEEKIVVHAEKQRTLGRNK